MTTAFLSYSHADEAVAERVRSHLDKQGIDVRTGMAVPVGESISTSILHEIERSDAVIFLISKEFAKSHWAQFEIAAATARINSGAVARIIPVLVGPDVDFEIDVPPLLSRFVGIDARSGVDEVDLSRLVAAIRSSEPTHSVVDQLAAEREMLELSREAQLAQMEHRLIEERAIFAALAGRRLARISLVFGLLTTLLTALLGVLAVASITSSDASLDGTSSVLIWVLLAMNAAVVVSAALRFRHSTLQRAQLWHLVESITRRDRV